MQLHYQSLGEGKPLILLHGLFGASNNWGTVAKHLAEQFQVVSVDLRNHGHSPHSDAQTYADMAQDLAELCDTLNITRTHLLGHSLGGKVAMQFATQFQQRVDQLVVVDMAMRAYPDAHTHLMDAMLAVDLSTLRSRSEVDTALSATIADAQIRQFLLMNLVKSDHVKSGTQLSWRINLTALKANYPALQQAVCEHVQYDQPCLFIRGEHSDYVQDADITQIQSHFTQAQFASLPTGHWLHAEQPQAFIGLVQRFLNA